MAKEITRSYEVLSVLYSIWQKWKTISFCSEMETENHQAIETMELLCVRDCKCCFDFRTPQDPRYRRSVVIGRVAEMRHPLKPGNY